MRWSLRTYYRSGTSTLYRATDPRPRYPLPDALTCSPPWRPSIRAAFVLSPYPDKSVLTGLRPTGDAFVGNLRNGGARRARSVKTQSHKCWGLYA